MGDSGEVLLWGENSFGQLGTGDGPDRASPAPVPALQGIPVKIVACAWSYCNAVSEDGDVWQWGYTRRGDFFSQLKPRRVEAVGHVLALACGGSHTIALAEGSHAGVWTWGSGGDGQLGH